MSFSFNYLALLLLLSGGFWSAIARGTLAQIIPDKSLGNEGSIVTPNTTVKDALADLISGGAVRGNNLFHSFSEFNIPDGGRVYFANPDGIANILTRVTGNNLSQIFGTLGVDGAAHLFLLNPNGIVFGENASLDVNGSFLATTANSYIFNNGFEYSASNPQSPPLLTINLPVGLQFGKLAEAIAVKGTGNNLSLDPETFELNWEARAKGLDVHSRNTIALVGGEINLQGGNLTASQGRIELAGIAEKGKVSLIPADNGFSLDSQENTNFKDINLTQSASIDTSGDGSGNLQLQGKNISLLDGSVIRTNTLGDENGRQVKINAADSINIAGTNADLFSSGIYNEVEADATGNGGNLSIAARNVELLGGNIYNDTSGTGKAGNLNINTNDLKIKEGSQIASGTFGAGDGGILSVSANNIELSGGSPFSPSGLRTDTFATGKGGNLIIDADNLQIKDGAQIGAGTWNNGDSGDVIIQATNVEVIGFKFANGFIYSSGIFAPVFSLEPNSDDSNLTGNGGNLIIDTEQLIVRDGGAIVSSTSGKGNAGNISLRVDNIEVRDAIVDEVGSRSGISSRVEARGSGNGGNVDIVANNFNLIDGGSISVDTIGLGNAGNIKINAQNINVSGVSSGEPVFSIEQKSLPSQISAFSEGDFAAGSININTDTLQVGDRGTISVSNLGNGNSGNLNITSRELNLDNFATLEAQVKTGNQGNINLTTDNLFLQNNSQITATATGTATGGNISINNTDNIVLLDNSQIIANAIEGMGGNINTTTQGLFTSPDSKISASSEFGLDGNVKVEAINGDRPIESEQLPEKPIQAAEQIAASCKMGNNQFTLASKGGLPQNPGQYLRGETVWQDLRLPLDKTTTNFTTNDLPIEQNSPQSNIVEAQAWKINSQGKVELVAVNSHLGLSFNPYQCSQITSN
jgi:filamentous hemagglutinin family protein